MKKVVQNAACIYTYICGGHKIICGYNFVALLGSMLSKYRNQSTDFHSIRWQHWIVMLNWLVFSIKTTPALL